MSTKNPSPDEPESERPERDPTDHSYTVHKIHQNGRDIYYTTIPIDDLFPYCFVERYCENPEEGYQRRYDKRRALDIAQYLATEGESIPSNIVLSAQSIAELTYTRTLPLWSSSITATNRSRARRAGARSAEHISA